MQPILELSGIEKRYPGVVALADAQFAVNPGEVHALVGENGAGKSTLVNVICGAVQPEEGRMTFLGRDYAPRSPQEAYRAGIRVVFQHLSLIPMLTVTENLFLGREQAGRFGFLARGAMSRRASDLLEELDFAHIPPESPVYRLSTSQKYLVEVAKAMLERPKLIVLDEPTAALNATETEVLFDLVRNLRDAGAGVIWITHRLEELYQITDRVTVMRDGRYVTTRSTQEVSREDLIRLMVGRDIDESMRSEPGSVGSGKKLIVNDLHSVGLIRGLSFDVHEGEILGMGGLAGSGIEEIGRAIYGLQGIHGGEVEILGRLYSHRRLRPSHLRRNGVFYLPGDRQGEGIVDVRPVLENITMSSLEMLGKLGFLHRMRERDVVADYIGKLRVKAASQAQAMGSLSGGNQQKVLFARGMLTEPQVFILEEPTQGVDVGSKADIYAVIRQLAGTGAAVIVISTDTRELLTVCHRVLAIAKGRVVREFAHHEATEEDLVAAYFGNETERTVV